MLGDERLLEIIDKEPKLKELTCFWCKSWIDCKCAGDPYNTNGDCLASK